MSDARIQRVNCLSLTSVGLMSGHGTPDLATAESKPSQQASNTGADNAAPTLRAPERRTGRVNDGSNTFSDQTRPGGKSRSQGHITEDNKVKDKKSDMGKSVSEMLGKNATTKTNFFLTSPKKTTFRAVKAKRTAADKKPSRSLYKEQVARRVGGSCWQDSTNGKPKSTKETFKQVKSYKSALCNQSESSELSDQIRAIAQKSRSGVTPPHQSKKQMSVTSQAAYLEWPEELISRNVALKQRTYFHPMSASRVAKAQSCQNCYFISFSVSPRKVSKSSDMAAYPRLEEAVRWKSFPHKCMGYENLFKTDSKIKISGLPNKQRVLSVQKSRSKIRGKMKAPGSEEVSRYRGSSKHSLDKRSEEGSMNESGSEVRKQLRESQMVRSKLSIRNVPCETHSIQNIFHNSALVFIRSDTQSKQAHKNAKTAKPKITLFSRNSIDSKKQASDFEHFFYRETMPSFNTSLRFKKSKKSQFPESSSQLTTAQKRSKDKITKRNTVTNRGQHSVVIRSRLPPARPTDESSLRLVYKKTKTGIKRPQQQKTVKNRDKSKLTETNADRKKMSEDLPSAGHILKKRPQTNICYYSNQAKDEGEPDIYSSSNMKLPNSEISKYIPETTNLDTAICSVQNAFAGENRWGSYDSSQERLSSFFRQLETCNGSERGDQVALLNGTFGLPAKAMSCSEQTGGIFQGQSLGNSKICIPGITNHTSIQQSRSSCCTLTFMPSLFRFLNCINKTISVPIFTKTPVNAIPFLKNDGEMHPINCGIKRLQLKNDDKLSTIEDSVSQKGSKCTQYETDEEQTLFDETLHEVDDLPVYDENTADTLPELKMPRVNHHGSNLTSFQTSEHDGVAQKHTRNTIFTPLSVSPTNAAKTILRTGHIDILKKIQQGGKSKHVKPSFKDNLIVKKDSNCWQEESEIKSKDSAHAVKWDIKSKLLILGIVCFTTIIQVILYYLIPRV